MASIRFSATSTASAATSLTVSLGGTPSVGDLVLVWVGCDNEIVVHQPGYLKTSTWFTMEGSRNADSSSLKGFYHTWNASDSGSSVVFTFSPASTLGVGDKDLSSVNTLAVAVVMTGPTSAILEDNAGSSGVSSPLKKASALALHACYANGSTATLSDSDGSAVSVQAVTNSSGLGQTLRVFSRATTSVGYAPTFTGASNILSQAATVSDSTSQVYNPPFIEEGPVSENRLFFRYKLQRYYTVRNISGTFSAARYLSTDDLNLATQVFVNNTPVSSTDRTNLLNSGVGGDFRATS